MDKITFWTRGALMAVLLGCAFLAGCVGPTAYQPWGATGGYRERLVGENRYYVEFFGNGFTTRDTVMAYWLHRCAELTQQKGFEYFVMVSKTPPPGASLYGPQIEINRVAAEDDGDPGVVRAKGGGVTYVPIYVPGGTITTWSSRGVIELRKGNAEADERPTYVAKDLLEKLGPPIKQAMQSRTNVTLPDDLFGREDRAARSGSAGGVKLDDLDALLPKQ